MISRGYSVVWNKYIDCLKEEPILDYDIIITNPPFRWNKKFIQRALDIWKPFVFLIRLEHIGWVDAMEVFDNDEIQIVIPEKRINYITPKILRWEKTWWATFHSIFVFYRMNLPQKIIYSKLLHINK